MSRDAYLPTLILPDKRSVFVSQFTHEVAEILGKYLKLTTTKHAQPIEVLERAHATIKTPFKLASGEYRKQWHKYLHIAILTYNTPKHSRIDGEPSRIIHCIVPHNILDNKLGWIIDPNMAPTTVFAVELLRITQILYYKTKKNVLQAHINYKTIKLKKKKLPPKTERKLFLTSAKGRPSSLKNSFS